MYVAYAAQLPHVDTLPLLVSPSQHLELKAKKPKQRKPRRSSQAEAELGGKLPGGPAPQTVVRTGTVGLAKYGFGSVSVAVAEPDAALRAEYISYIMCRLVNVGAVPPSFRGVKLQASPHEGDVL